MDLRRRRFLYLTTGAAAFPTIAGSARAQIYPAKPVRAICRRRADRCLRATDRAVSFTGAWPAILCGESTGRGRKSRHGRGRPSGPRRLRNHDCQHELRRRSQPLCENSLRPIEGFCAGHSGGRFSQCAGDSSIDSRRQRQGAGSFLKANPGKYSIAHPGVGTTSQLSGEMFKHSQDLDLVSVPFNGSAPAIQSALAGHTPVAFHRAHAGGTAGQGGQVTRARSHDAEALARAYRL
jgi:hypothetical protein